MPGLVEWIQLPHHWLAILNKAKTPSPTPFSLKATYFLDIASHLKLYIEKWFEQVPEKTSVLSDQIF